MTNPIGQRVDTFFIHVTDLQRSIEWYSKLLGVEVEKEKILGPIYTFYMEKGGVGITLDDHCLDEDYRFFPSNQPLFTIRTTSILQAFQFVSELGAEMVTDIITFPDLSEFSFKDPDGNIIMVCTCFN